MIGWNISVHRQKGGGIQPASFDSHCGEKLAVWQASHRGRDWLDELVRESRAINLGGNGYPSRYTSKTKEIVPKLTPTPPHANVVWQAGPGDTLTEKWRGKTFLDHQGLAQCDLEEWLLIEVWDES